MIKNELKNDINFVQKCNKYGLDFDNFNIYENVIILNSPKKDIFVLLDENYNTIGILNMKGAVGMLEDYVLEYKEMFNSLNERNGLFFPYPFQDFTLREIVELSNRIDRHNNDLIINGKLAIEEGNSIYISLLSYIKFLGQQIEQYFLNYYNMMMMGFEYPDIYSYIRSLMSNINKLITLNIEEKKRPFPIDIIKYLGQNRENAEKYSIELYKIIDLLLKENGYEIQGGFEHYREIRKIETENIDLSIFAMDLLKILELPRVKNDMNFGMETINLQELFNEKVKIKSFQIDN